MKIRSFALTDVGRRREHNEDSLAAHDASGVYLVADGMGGHRAGERASALASEELVNRLSAKAPVLQSRKEIIARMEQAIRETNRAVYAASLSKEEWHGMGTTLTSLWFVDENVCVGHVGDSRAYLFRHGRFEQLTSDHSWVQEQVAAGLLAEADAKHSPFKHIVTRSIGLEFDVEVDLRVMAVQAGDCFVICSDGLSNFVDNEEIGKIVQETFYAEVPRTLVALANARGGDDNITVVVAYVANDN